ncbi:hypothetical protein BDK51DRAFT_50493 [Blyttiomyces helicus]|uniref:Uncharacterized protein n=1 Tax=Blyttiomyces helicus TaxID=388810 RepID=A0A4P9W1Z8_9FUNG|nr:hypothetical protein BDK51DRAFT_50493 [Blyttiomyces helicus]|eukprot:RKO84788.1 hypothetical protein BDK51DRAFT_50493 [Blyttiomyces helicus]
MHMGSGDKSNHRRRRSCCRLCASSAMVRDGANVSTHPSLPPIPWSPVATAPALATAPRQDTHRHCSRQERRRVQDLAEVAAKTKHSTVTFSGAMDPRVAAPDSYKESPSTTNYRVPSIQLFPNPATPKPLPLPSPWTPSPPPQPPPPLPRNSRPRCRPRSHTDPRPQSPPSRQKVPRATSEAKSPALLDASRRAASAVCLRKFAVVMWDRRNVELRATSEWGLLRQVPAIADFRSKGPVHPAPRVRGFGPDGGTPKVPISGGARPAAPRTARGGGGGRGRGDRPTLTNGHHNPHQSRDPRALHDRPARIRPQARGPHPRDGGRRPPQAEREVLPPRVHRGLLLLLRA